MWKSQREMKWEGHLEAHIRNAGRNQRCRAQPSSARTRICGLASYYFEHCGTLICQPARRRTCSRCRLEMRDIAATIMPDNNCMVATSRSSKAPGEEDRTSKTPRVLR